MEPEDPDDSDSKEETGGHSPLPVNLSYAVQQVLVISTLNQRL